MPDRDITPTLAASVLAGYLRQAINPAVDARDAPVAAALLHPVARKVVDLLTADGYRLVKKPRDPGPGHSRPVLTLLPGGWGCHNGTCPDCHLHPA